MSWWVWAIPSKYTRTCWGGKKEIVTGAHSGRKAMLFSRLFSCRSSICRAWARPMARGLNPAHETPADSRSKGALYRRITSAPGVNPRASSRSRVNPFPWTRLIMPWAWGAKSSRCRAHHLTSLAYAASPVKRAYPAATATMRRRLFHSTLRSVENLRRILHTFVFPIA